MGVVNIKKIYLLVLLSVMFITMSMVSAANTIHTADLDSQDSTLTKDTTTTAGVITKKVNDNVTKTSTNQKTKTKTSVTSLKVKYDSTAKLSAKVTDVKGNNVTAGKVIFKVNGKTVGKTTVKKGEANYNYDTSSLTTKTYTVTANYTESTQLLSSSANSTLTVVKATSEVMVKDYTVTYKHPVTLVATVTNKDTGSFVNGGKVTFKLNGKSVKTVKVTNGMAYYTYTANKKPGKYTFTASYAGSKLYTSAVSNTASLNITKGFIKINTIKVSGYSSSIRLKANVVDKYTSKNLTSGTVIFKVNYKTVGRSKVKNGTASLKYDTTMLTNGKYKVTAQYKPTSYYYGNSSSNTMTVKAEKEFNYSQVKAAAVHVRTQLEANNKVSSVHVSKTRMNLADFLALMIQTAANANKGKSSAKVSYKHYDDITTQIDTLTTGKLNISQVLDIGSRTLTFMNENNRPPKYSNTVFGQMGYYNIIYSYTKVLDVSTSKYLPSTCRVYPWSKIHPTNPKKRTIYITSDEIRNKTADYEFMNKVKKALEKKGYKVVVEGYGPNSHNKAIRNGSLPVNAVQLSLFGGADPGVIYDLCTRSFMRLKENRLMFLAYKPSSSTDITGLSFLARAHDDNYSPSSFTGIEHPDIYLKNHGYDYVYSFDVNTIVNRLIKYIS